MNMTVKSKTTVSSTRTTKKATRAKSAPVQSARNRKSRSAEGDLNPTSVTSPAVLNVQAYLQILLHEVENIEIAGIASRPGRSSDALVSKIEELYTPLASRPSEITRKGFGRSRGAERVLLPGLLPQFDRLLLIGQPGSGKTTFLRLVACMLARDILGHRRSPPWRVEHLGLPARMRPPIPCLLRMATLVVLFEKFSQPGRLDTRAWLLDLLAAQSCLTRSQIVEALQDPKHMARCEQWDALLTKGRVLLLLDGLDEVADLTLRRRVARIFQDACVAWPNSRIVVTSRPIDHAQFRELGFHMATIEPFGSAEIERFVERWSTALFQGRTDRSEEHARTLLAALRERPDIRLLATNPVMLTCLCVIHWNEGHMPEGRARVYRAIFTWMLGARSEQRWRAGFTNAFAENAFSALALAMTNHDEGKLATFDVAMAIPAIDEEMRRHLPNFKPELQQRANTEVGRRRVAHEWLLRECEWSHIIEEVAGNQLRFWHLTLQEFLAALALAWRDDGDGPEDWWPIIKVRLDDPQWRETLELLPGCLYDEGGQRRVDRMVGRLLELARPGDLQSEARAFGLAGCLLAPMSVFKYSPRLQIVADFEAIRARVMAIFSHEGSVSVPLKTRIRAAEALGRAGDPRLVAENFIPIPGTPVSMGRFPVTVSEFARFVDDTEGYALADWWDREGLTWRVESRREHPRAWDEQKQFPNHPVTGVSWWEARAYCRWMTHRQARQIRLPTVREWEAAATSRHGPYPWGGTAPTEEMVNFRQSVGSPTPVGLYPEGAGPYGHLDLAGNVYERCEDGPKNEPGQRWLKGGSWSDHNTRVFTTTYRYRHWLDYIDIDGDHIGFRIVAARTPIARSTSSHPDNPIVRQQSLHAKPKHR